MIKTNYQTYGSSGFYLRLRIYQNGETRYVSVNKLLQGNLTKRHWNQKKQLFIPSAPFSKENNEALVQFKRKFDEKAIDWSGSVFNLVSEASAPNSDGKPLMATFLSDFIEETKKRKHSDGTLKGTYEGYEKLRRRLQEFCIYQKINWETLLVEDFTISFVNAIFDWLDKENKGRGKVYVSSMLHSVLNHASKLGLLDMDSLKAAKWAKKPSASAHKYRTLTSAQCNRLMTMKGTELPSGPNKILYRDFCVFLLFTGQSPCDAISLKYSDIEVIDGISYFVFKRRKISDKQPVPCTVPINSVLQGIMDKWRRASKDGYVFPIRNKHKLMTQKVNNGDIKHFISKANTWLKKLGVILGCDFPLHLYTFRHTAITNYISKEVPVIYVANMMGTSVDNCEKIYYNNRGDVKSRNKVLKLTSF